MVNYYTVVIPVAGMDGPGKITRITVNGETFQRVVPGVECDTCSVIRLQLMAAQEELAAIRRKAYPAAQVLNWRDIFPDEKRVTLEGEEVDLLWNYLRMNYIDSELAHNMYNKMRGRYGE